MSAGKLPPSSVGSDRAAAPCTEPMPSFEEVYWENLHYVLGMTTRLLGPESDVEDVVHEVFISAMRTLPQLRDPRALRAWLGRIVVRKVATRIAWKRVRRTFGLLPRDEAAIPSPAAGPEDRARVRSIYEALDRMPAADRVAWLLHFVEEERLEDVARLCGCSVATVKRRIARAQERLRREGHA